MKRLALRTGALAAVLVGGGVGIFAAKQMLVQDEVQAQQIEADSQATPVDEAPPKADSSEPRAAAARDPFTGGRLLNELGDHRSSDEPQPTAAPPSRYAGHGSLPQHEAADGAPNPLRGTLPAEPLSVEDSPRSDPFAARQVSDERLLASNEAAPPQAAEPAADPLGRYGEPLDAAAGPATQNPLPGGPMPRDTDPRAIDGQDVPVEAAPIEQPIESAEHEPLRRLSEAPPAEEPRAFAPAGQRPFEESPGFTAKPPATSAEPGATKLEGVQVPTLQLQKTAPAEIQVGKPATFQIMVRNTGQVAAHDVVVSDQAPRGTRLIATEPQAETLADGVVQWRLGSLASGEERLLTLELMPTAEGEVGSVASVQFRAEASVRTVVTKPELLLEVAGPREVMIDAPLTINVKVTNPGSGEATGVVLYETVPPSLEHPAGDELEFEIGSLKPNETREIALNLHARQAGPVRNIISVRGDAQLQAETEVAFEVIAPRLEVALQGPKLRYLEREATYQVSVANPGTAPAKEVELVSRLPQGMKFVSANNAGQYDHATHSVYWSLAELPEGGSGTVELVALPIEPGEQAIRIEGKAEQGLSDSQETAVMVEGIAALYFGVVDVADPIEIGGASSYEIRVVNQGTKTADDVRLVAQFPPGLRPTAADGPSRGTIEGNRVLFEPLARLAPKADTTYMIQFEGAAAGDQRVTVQVISADMQQPVTKEESTKVYADR